MRANKDAVSEHTIMFLYLSSSPSHSWFQCARKKPKEDKEKKKSTITDKGTLGLEGKSQIGCPSSELSLKSIGFDRETREWTLLALAFRQSR